MFTNLMQTRLILVWMLEINVGFFFFFGFLILDMYVKSCKFNFPELCPNTLILLTFSSYRARITNSLCQLKLLRLKNSGFTEDTQWEYLNISCNVIYKGYKFSGICPIIYRPMKTSLPILYLTYNYNLSIVRTVDHLKKFPLPSAFLMLLCPVYEIWPQVNYVTFTM